MQTLQTCSNFHACKNIWRFISIDNNYSRYNVEGPYKLIVLRAAAPENRAAGRRTFFCSSIGRR